jgi:hypothetical protein
MTIPLKWRIIALLVFVLCVAAYFVATRTLDRLVNDGTLGRLVAAKRP